MSLTFFTDLNPWYVQKGTDNTSLYRCYAKNIARRVVNIGGTEIKFLTRTDSHGVSTII